VKTNSDILLEMKNMSKEFPSVKALNNVNLTVKKGTVHALMGENGAGKSTLMKCLFGIIGGFTGEILLDGVPVSFKNPKDALNHGVAMVHQELNQALKRSVMDNVWLGRYPTAFGVFVSEKKMYEDTVKVLDELEIKLNPRAIMSTLPVAKRQMVEIAKAVSYNAKIIVLDEPTSSLNDSEVEQLFKIINKLRKKGCAIIYISHKMEEILKISDEVTIMRDGKYVTTRPANELDMNTIIKLMVGRELTSRFPPKFTDVGEVTLKVEGLSTAYTGLSDISFEARAGEIVGVAGLDGSGRTELLEAIFGLTEKSGKISLNGVEVKNLSPRASIKNGFALLTEERRRNGIFGILNIRDNTVISSIEDYREALLYLNSSKMNASTEKMIGALNIKTPSQGTKISTLSGGNQQKVIFGRWLLTSPEVLLLDEPTRGIDVGAKYEIYQLIIDLAKKGKTIIMVSSEMPELIGICSRILVMSGGKLAGQVQANEQAQEEIMHLATLNV
jgi:methyl-galactoside transport system ATP-binding protein